GVVFVVLAPGAAEPDLRAWSARHLADYKKPDRVVVVPELPLTSMLKTDRAALRTRALALPAQER
ncbi:MAG: putative acyl-CoA synthetase, partial [Frankiales bacterium]|nr:putative acyl-CoA synthetase [Frankiales bacterium]